jgi:hypothetical protein
MQDKDAIIQQLTDENQYLRDQITGPKLRLDEALNCIALLREENQRLKDEIATLKGQKPRPNIPPSTLEGPKSNGKNKNSLSRGKHPRQKKKEQLHFHSKQRIKPTTIPEGAVFKGYKRYAVQDIAFRPHNTLYELERWQLPDGSYITGKLPTAIQGHYGPQLIAYILHQHYGCRVTEHLLLNQLREIGVLISEGQLSNILIEGKEAFHEEKDSLLRAGIETTGQIQADDTGARHKGQNGYSTVIGNEFFTSITTTESKSRINFLQILHGKAPQYLINADAAAYVEAIKPSSWLQSLLFLNTRDIAMNQEEWEKCLVEINVTAEHDVRLMTEAALYASLIDKGIPRDLGVHSDDAGQFDVFVHSLCWIHEERHYRKIIPIDEEMRDAIERVRDEIWGLYKALKEYKLAPDEMMKAYLEQQFEAVFKQQTASMTLNKQLEKTYAKKEELLRVLERPGTPLHNNVMETDARERVVVRKISGGTRSEEGKECLDTFVSLKKTCGKLGISFFNYLCDRVSGLFEIPPLAQTIRSRAAQSR